MDPIHLNLTRCATACMTVHDKIRSFWSRPRRVLVASLQQQGVFGLIKGLVWGGGIALFTAGFEPAARVAL